MSELALNPWLDAGKIQQQFVLSQDLEACLMGPRGEGKTEGGIRRMTLHAGEQEQSVRPIPWAIVRDTWKNLERTTLKSFLQPHPNSFSEKIRPLLKVSGGGEKIVLPGFWEAHLFGVDSLGDLSRLQSLQLGGIWLEEPAPAAAEDIGGGLEERVVTVGITSLRHPCAWRTVQITQNYPDEDHWTWQRYFIRREGRLFRIPRGENPHLPTDYRDNMERALANDKGLLNRLVLGQPGFVSQGEAVTPEYDSLVHRSNIDLEPYPNTVGYRFWDGYSNPACVIAQLTPRGQLQVFEAIVGKGMGVKQLIRDFVIPAISERYGDVPEWEDIGDPSMVTKDQSDYEQSAAMVIEKELKTFFRPGPKAWSIRQQGMKNALLATIPGNKPFVYLSASPLVQPLHQALRGGWAYRMSPSGLRIGTIPMKNHHSHPADALSYGVCELLSMSEGGRIDPYVQPSVDYYMEELIFRQTPGMGSVGRDPVTGY
jgi:hypothetical protein